MSAFETVKVEINGPVAVVTINRPEAMNSINLQLRRELLAAVRQVNENVAVRVAILTGEGRAFGAGADLKDGVMGSDVYVEDALNGEYKPVLMAITEAPQPWISAVAGAAAGVSSAFAMACDLTVMADNAYIYQAFTAISLIPDGGATWHLVRTVGRKRAYEIIVSGEKIGAQQCLELGLCNRVVPVDELMSETLAWAQQLAAKAPLSLRYAKQALNQAMEASVDQMISEEAKLQHICITSEDAQEGITAFLEKREPQWKGR
jgi:2-(1,2-epoxy-1,2-dihydrophenyl)acetyl-CoA isomerase